MHVKYISGWLLYHAKLHQTYTVTFPICMYPTMYPKCGGGVAGSWQGCGRVVAGCGNQVCGIGVAGVCHWRGTCGIGVAVALAWQHVVGDM